MQQVVLYCYQDKNIWYDNYIDSTLIHPFDLIKDNGNFSMLAERRTTTNAIVLQKMMFTKTMIVLPSLCN